MVVIIIGLFILFQIFGWGYVIWDYMRRYQLLEEHYFQTERTFREAMILHTKGLISDREFKKHTEEYKKASKIFMDLINGGEE